MSVEAGGVDHVGVRFSMAQLFKNLLLIAIRPGSKNELFIKILLSVRILSIPFDFQCIMIKWVMNQLFTSHLFIFG